MARSCSDSVPDQSKLSNLGYGICTGSADVSITVLCSYTGKFFW